MQLPIIEAYLEELPEGVAPRILASRTALAVDPENLSRALELAEPGLRTLAALQPGFDADGASIEELIAVTDRSEEHTSELQSRGHLVCRLLLETKKLNLAE